MSIPFPPLELEVIYYLYDVSLILFIFSTNHKLFNYDTIGREMNVYSDLATVDLTIDSLQDLTLERIYKILFLKFDNEDGEISETKGSFMKLI